jgi:molybdopterin-containing oxidoreductase family iron-sulfur binding subunit
MSLVERDAPDIAPTGQPLENGDLDLTTTRRTFLKAAGFSFAGALAANCSRAPVGEALPYVQQPEGIVPGRKYLYASTCGACESRCGILVTDRDGRPVKIEGNPDHPLSGGATCAVGQASILGLYDSLRLKRPVKRGQPSSWPEVDQEIGTALDDVREKRRALRIVTPTITSPTTAAAIAAFVGRFPNAKHVSYDAISTSALLDAYADTHGARLLPRYRFDKADVVVSFDADFLATWISPVEYARGYASRRRLDDRGQSMSYHVQFESRMSLTGSRADRRVRVAPGDLGHVATHLARRLARRAGLAFAADNLAPSRFEPALDDIALRLWNARRRALVVSGSGDIRVQRLSNLINYLVEAYGATVDVDRPSYQRAGGDRDLAELRAELSRGEVGALIFAGVNPVYDLPDQSSLAGDIKRVPVVVSTAERVDETASLAHFVCPDHHYLESWGDAEAVAGLVSLTQPAIQPLGDTRSVVESLTQWTTGESKPALELIREHWEREIYPRAGASGSFDEFWNRTLEIGAAEVKARPAPARSFTAAKVAPVNRSDDVPEGTLALVLHPTVGMLDGRPGHNAWLHELPDPVTKLTWDNCLSLSPATARRLDVTDGDVVRVTVESGAALDLPAFVQPGQHDQVAAAPLGYGRAGTERFAGIGPPWIEARRRAGVVGVNVAPFVTAVDGLRWYAGRKVTIIKTGRTHDLASTQLHYSLAVPAAAAPGAHEEPPPIIQETTLADLARSRPDTREAAPPELWPPDHAYTGRRWGMTIDLTACTGCSACVVACQVENNIPVVGQDEVRRKRQMHWIRIDRYYSGGEEEPDVVHQPMLCQQCEHAPCETVCPVLATVHSDEGLNQQVYNRCVGTRYCANNCPYKVRRFNWFDYPHNDRLQNLVLNPNVTVRSRGVMEKCTFCVQRIEEAKIESRRTGEPIGDGTLMTACQQVCPTQAIVFGDLNDPNSRVATLARSGRAYRVLEELNTEPAVRYLSLVRHGGTEVKRG